jgi:hypothetical protein
MVTPQVLNRSSDTIRTGKQMAKPLTPKEEEQLKELRRRKAKMLRDEKRQRAYTPRKKED